MQGRGVVSGLFAVLVLGVWVVPELYQLLFSSHPVEHGSRIIYRVKESLGNGSETSFGVVLRFKERPQGGFQLVIDSPHGVRKLNVLEDTLLPTADRDNDPLEIPTKSGMQARPSMLWLPPDRRAPGKTCIAGRVLGVQSFAGMRAWQVGHPDGLVYFDEETGLLRGFELEYGLATVNGRLRSIR